MITLLSVLGISLNPSMETLDLAIAEVSRKLLLGPDLERECWDVVQLDIMADWREVLQSFLHFDCCLQLGRRLYDIQGVEVLDTLTLSHPGQSNTFHWLGLLLLLDALYVSVTGIIGYTCLSIASQTIGIVLEEFLLSIDFSKIILSLYILMNFLSNFCHLSNYTLGGGRRFFKLLVRLLKHLPCHVFIVFMLFKSLSYLLLEFFGLLIWFLILTVHKFYFSCLLEDRYKLRVC